MAEDSQSKEHAQTADNHSYKKEVELDLDWTSSSGSSSDEENDEQDDNADSNSKPAMLPKVDEDLKKRLVSFLPQIQNANKELDDPDQARQRQMDSVSDNEGQYVEMNLGLGVLTEKTNQDDVQTYDTADDDSSAEMVISRNDGPREQSQTKKIEEI